MKRIFATVSLILVLMLFSLVVQKIRIDSLLSTSHSATWSEPLPIR